MDPVTLALFAGALMLAAGSPGPSVAALVARVLARGWRDVIPFLAAMWLGEVIWLTMALAGLSALAQAFQPAFLALKWAGIAYLAWLAFRLWTQAPQAAGELPRRTSGWAMFGAGMALTLGNPKIMVFYVALLPVLIDVPAVGLAEWALLSLVTLAALAVVDLAWVALAERARAFLRTPRAILLANRVSAATLGGAAVAVAARG